jgi:hypothetical protein
MVDSVVVTNERAVVVQGAWADASVGGGFYPIVWLMDLTLSPPAAYMVDGYEILKAEPRNYDPHDVAITPPLTEIDANDRLAVVTCDFATLLFDLANISLPANVLDPQLNHAGTETDDFMRGYYRQVDSVELTYDHAVVIGWMKDPTTDKLIWSVKDFSLRQSPTDPALTNVMDESGEDYMPHDLFIHQAADAAVIKIGNASAGLNLVVQNVSTAPVLSLLPAGGTPYADWGSFPTPTPGSSVRFSDSVLTATVRKGGTVFDYAVTLGGQLNVPANKIVAKLDLLDLSVPSFNTSFLAGHALHDTMPTDLDFSSSMGRMFVRCQAPPDESPTPPTTPGRDVLVVDLGATPPVLEVGTATGPQIGGRGLIRDQVDSMITKRLRALSISEYDPSVVPTAEGYVHTSTNP